ncbi:MAG: SRPBCC domain-containing protein [Thermodesulfobacteriota bacterium]
MGGRYDNLAEHTENSDLVLTRAFDAPRERVWAAWTEPDRFAQWWGPEGFTAPRCSMDLRVGGKYLWCMRSPEGRDYWSTGVYLEIVPLKKLVLTDSFSDKDGNIVPASHYGITGGWPRELYIAVTFEEEEEGRTTVTLRHSGIPQEMMDDCATGWNGSFDKLRDSVE